MKSISYKFFKFDEIFVCERGTRLTKENQISGDIAYISSTKRNHGIDNFIDPPENMNIYQNKMTLSNSGSVGYLFYHNYPFVASDHVTVIDIGESNKLNLKIALYLKPIFESFSYKYNFAREISNKRLKREKIKLPTDENDNPNWEYMEQYILELCKKINLKNNFYHKQSKIILNVETWKYFDLYGKNGLFEIEKGKSIINELDYGDYPLISSTKFNNGFNSYRDPVDVKIFPENRITVASNGTVGKTFYQEEKFIATGDINVLKLKRYKLNKYLALFLSTIIEKESFRYNYGRKWGLNKMKKSKIKLPCDKNNKPNWKYMENYMKSLPYSKNL